MIGEWVTTIYVALYIALVLAIIYVILDYAPLIKQWRLQYAAKPLPGTVHPKSCTCWLCQPPKPVTASIKPVQVVQQKPYQPPIQPIQPFITPTMTIPVDDDV